MTFFAVRSSSNNIWLHNHWCNLVNDFYLLKSEKNQSNELWHSVSVSAKPWVSWHLLNLQWDIRGRLFIFKFDQNVVYFIQTVRTSCGIVILLNASDTFNFWTNIQRRENTTIKLQSNSYVVSYCTTVSQSLHSSNSFLI